MASSPTPAPIEQRTSEEALLGWARALTATLTAAASDPGAPLAEQQRAFADKMPEAAAAAAEALCAAEASVTFSAKLVRFEAEHSEALARERRLHSELEHALEAAESTFAAAQPEAGLPPAAQAAAAAAVGPATQACARLMADVEAAREATTAKLDVLRAAAADEERVVSEANAAVRNLLGFEFRQRAQAARSAPSRAYPDGAEGHAEP